MVPKIKIIIFALALVLVGVVVAQLIAQEDPSLPRIKAKSANALSSLPNFSKYTEVKEKKKAFFTTLYPIIEEENKHVLKLRAAIVALQEVPFETLQPNQLIWLGELAEHYRLGNTALSVNTFDELLTRVDIIPPSLALTQAAIESGWGSSRFSKKGNNIFGQWCFSKGCGIVPASRDSDKAHEVAKYSTVNAAVRAYIRNLNTNAAYQTLREKRANIRKENAELTGVALAKTLIGYSEEREKYIVKVTKFINQNKLQRFNKRFNDTLIADASPQ